MRKFSKHELNVEDLVFNEEREESDYLELPLSRQAFLLVLIATIVIGSVALIRIGFLNVALGSFYANRANANVGKEITLPAPRGIIVDRFGNPLVENKSAFSAFLNIGEALKDPDRLDSLVDSIAEILPSVDAAALKSVIAEFDLETSGSIAVARNITAAEAIRIKDLNLPYLQVTDDYIRDYSKGPALSHVLGYVGVAEKHNTFGGRAGLELQYNDHLRGVDGRLVIYRDATGKPIDTKVADLPQAGGKLVTSIDADLQDYFYKRLKQGLATLGRDAGVGLAMDPRTGEVLAMVSMPSFDNNKVAKYLSAPHQPLFNRAVSGIYTPGSTIKPLVGLAALREQVIDPLKQILSVGYIELPNPYDPEKPSRFVDWRPQGWVDIRSALAKSSNVYFYEVGGGYQDQKGLGIEKLHEYWRYFLLGHKTGIDLPGEGAGFLPAPEEKEKRTGQIWRIGDTYNVSIGQGDLMLTPIQLMSFIASIANGGVIYQPRMITGQPPVALLDYSDWQMELSEVVEGMKDAVRKSYGTAHLLSGLPMSSAGKTGSSQVSNNTKTNAFFVGYAPADPGEGEARIAILVLIENAREGSSNTIPIANDVLNWYYENRIANEKSAL